MKPDRFDHFVWTILFVLAAAIGTVSWIGNQRGISVSATTPELNEETSMMGLITVEFPQMITTEDVSSYFNLEPSVAGQILLNGQEIVFVPAQSFDPEVEYTAIVKAGITVQDGRELKQDFIWKFSVREPEFFFRSSEDLNLYRASLDGEEITALSDEGILIFDFAPSRDGSMIAYTVTNEQLGIDLWLMDRNGENRRKLVDCGLGFCMAPNWSPDGTTIACNYREAGLGPTDPISVSRVWLVDTASGESSRLSEDSQKLGYGPIWSPDGKTLAYADGLNAKNYIRDMKTGSEFSITNNAGQAGSWSPDSRYLVYTDMQTRVDGTDYFINLLDTRNGDITSLLEGSETGETYFHPVWSPADEWIAVNVQLNADEFQYAIRLISPDGSSSQTLTDAHDYSYSNYSFDPSGGYLLFQRYQLGVSYTTIETVVMDVYTREEITVISGASFPEWLP